jgi:hypothetical protein
VQVQQHAWVPNIEKAFTQRLYCPPKLIVKPGNWRGVSACDCHAPSFLKYAELFWLQRICNMNCGANRTARDKNLLLSRRRGVFWRLLALYIELVPVRRRFLLLRLRPKISQAFHETRNLAFGVIYFSQRQQQMIDGDLVVGIFAEDQAALFNGPLILAGLQIEIAEHIAGERKVRL